MISISVKNIKKVNCSSNIANDCKEVDLIIIHTEWNDFKSIDFKKVIKNKKTLIFDMRNLYSPQVMTKNKLSYFSVGRGLK